MVTAPLSDAQLVSRCRSRDPEAWSQLVERFSRYVYAIATQAFRLSQPDAEDVFQEVFARTYERLDTLRDDAAIRPWLGQLTRRLAIDRLRAQGRELPVDELPEAAGPDPALARIEEAMSVRDALTTLPVNCQDVLERFFVRDETYRVIGRALGIPSGTVASRISRCLERLRTALAGSLVGTEGR